MELFLIMMETYTVSIHSCLVRNQFKRKVIFFFYLMAFCIEITLKAICEPVYLFTRNMQ